VLTWEHRGLSAGELVVAYATELIGIPYKWGNANPEVGFDCSGMVWYVYRRLGVKVPRSTSGMERLGQAVASIEDAKPGDILCFGRRVRHVGIYVGDNRMIHAPQRGKRIVIVDLNRTPSYIRRVFN
jgi:cell wall-associated NlpC family hydrolase